MPITISEAKLRDYLLNPDHPQNGDKAKFFLGGGGRVENLVLFEAALIAHLQRSRHVKREASRFGIRLVVEGALKVPDGRTPLVRSVWMFEEASIAAKFTTAYPIDALDTAGGENPFSSSK